jgi:hypothetical protein
MSSSSPTVEEDTISKIIERVDVCLGTNITYASEAKLVEFKELQSNHRKKQKCIVKSSIDFFEKFKDAKKKRKKKKKKTR